MGGEGEGVYGEGEAVYREGNLLSRCCERRQSPHYTQPEGYRLFSSIHLYPTIFSHFYPNYQLNPAGIKYRPLIHTPQPTKMQNSKM